MKRLIENSSGFLIILALSLSACANILSTASLNKDAKFEKINLGDKIQQVESMWGKTEIETEIYPTVQLSALNYTDSQGRPAAFFTIDPKTQKVVGKSKWIYSTDPLYNLNSLLENKFKSIQFITYSPCTTRGQNEKILINREQGLYIATTNNHADLISWMTPNFVSIVIEGLYKKCPLLQPKKL